MNRDDKDYAIEFGEYLATSADEFLQSCNALEASRMLSDFGAQTVAEQGHNDAWRTTSRQLLEVWLDARKCYPDMYLSAHSAGLAALEPDAGDCRGGCQAGMSIGCITAQGDVTPCVMFPLVLGNLKQRSLRDIWGQSDAVARLKAREVGGICGTCRYKKDCGGCRAAAWAVNGDMMAEDPYCWIANPPEVQQSGKSEAEHAAHHHL